MGILDVMAKDSRFNCKISRKIDSARTTLFFDIIARRIPADQTGARPCSDETPGPWPHEFIGSLPSQTTCLLTECHLWAYIQAPGWSLSQSLFSPGISVQNVEALFRDPQSRATDQMYLIDLRTRLLSSEGGADLIRILRAVFTKMGLVERAVWSKRNTSDPPFSPNHEIRESLPVAGWANATLEDRITRTHQCIRDICEAR